MSRIGIMGGTFNPIHIAHLLLAERALEQFHLDQIMFLPSKRPAYKKTEDLLPDELRYQMVELSIQGNDAFFASDMELRREGITYTADTIRELKNKFPDNEYYFIMGGDSLMTLEQWYHPEVLMNGAAILVAARPDAETKYALPQMEAKVEELNLKYHARIHIFSAPFMDVSSTEIRRRLKDRQSIRYLVAEPVRILLEGQRDETNR